MNDSVCVGAAPRFDSAARHGFGERAVHDRKVLAQRRDKLIDLAGTRQRIDLAGKLP